MNISQAAQRAGLSSKALRYYETINLLQPARGPNGYREYSRDDVETLQFIQRARACGFAVEEVRQLLALHRDPARQSHDAKQLVEEKLQQIEQQLQTLKIMKKTLRGLADSCAGDDSPECAILSQLANRV
ncbi:MerR family transcriptional regulator [Microbulbifer harenosus]|uniref:MerR family transcriptional regulator n=1 Tax=Microbulbifer harenosus TaxID=2576840 RepID=A0ABY2UJG8_9GAMM|nr:MULTISPECIES: MerR family transcriptional regulator [Microbulbifer]QIL88852.1 MerR family transcriptional regulator [Microbulbifer sp. SH-1]TLM77821.1 MerR family transcriptional regulator [Microbulbifer harenosus]